MANFAEGKETFDFPVVELKWFVQNLRESYRSELIRLHQAEKLDAVIAQLNAALVKIPEGKDADAYRAKLGQAKNMRAKLGKVVPTPMLAIGVAGIGKTEGIKGITTGEKDSLTGDAELTKALELKEPIKVNFKEMRLVNYTETDLIGLPYITGEGENTKTEHAPNTLFPTEEKDGKYGILLIDEFSSAPRAIQVPILQLTDASRSIGQYKLPAGWKVVIAGNGPNDGGTFTNLPGTIISRSACFYVIPNESGWLDWAAQHYIHPSIRAYIAANPSAIHSYNENEDDGYDRAFASPRSWTNLSVVMTDFYNKHPDFAKSDKSTTTLDTICFERMAAAHIGKTAANSFIAFLAFEKYTMPPKYICNPELYAKDKKENKVDSATPYYKTVKDLQKATNGKNYNSIIHLIISNITDYCSTEIDSHILATKFSDDPETNRKMKIEMIANLFGNAIMWMAGAEPGSETVRVGSANEYVETLASVIFSTIDPSYAAEVVVRLKNSKFKEIGLLLNEIRQAIGSN